MEGTIKKFSAVGDGAKVENKDGSKMNWHNLQRKMTKYIGPYKMEIFFKDPEF